MPSRKRAVEVVDLLARQSDPDELGSPHAEVRERLLPCPLQVAPARIVIADEVDDGTLPGAGVAMVQHLGHVVLQLERATAVRSARVTVSN